MTEHTWHQLYVPPNRDSPCLCPDCPKKVVEIPDTERMKIRSKAELAKNHEFVLVVEVPDPDWTPPIHATHPHALGCPRHRPVKQYCRIHHTGFHGHCHQCQLEDQPVVVTVASDESKAAAKAVIQSAIADLS